MQSKSCGGTMKGFRHDIDCHDEPIEIVALADLHLGDKNCNISLVQSLIDGIKENRNRYCILVGDLMNTAIMNSKSDTYAETMRPSEQLTRCYDLLNPIRDKILAVVPGNHEERISRTAGVDMTQLLSRELGVEHLYSDTTALVFLSFGLDSKHKRPLIYSMYINHGRGSGGRKAGSKVNALQDMASVIDADVFVVAHTHLPATFKQQSYRVCNSSNSAVLHEQLFVNTASALEYAGYGRRGAYIPNSNAYPIIILDNQQHEMKVLL